MRARRCRRLTVLDPVTGVTVEAEVCLDGDAEAVHNLAAHVRLAPAVGDELLLQLPEEE